MSTSDLTLTLVGWVATEPKHYTGPAVTPFTSFRMAHTRRRFDRAQNTWTDGRTEWFTVKLWRQSALNVAGSLRKGDPVVVHGRLSTEQWDSPEGPRTSLVLEALAIGPDLTYGRASFARTVHVGGGTGVSAGPDGTGAVVEAGGETEADDGDGSDDPWLGDFEGGAESAAHTSEPGRVGGSDGVDAGHGSGADVTADFDRVG
jgi:single-strand DNA-binding protein